MRCVLELARVRPYWPGLWGLGLWGLGFRVQGSGLRFGVKGLGFGVLGLLGI